MTLEEGFLRKWAVAEGGVEVGQGGVVASLKLGCMGGRHTSTVNNATQSRSVMERHG